MNASRVCMAWIKPILGIHLHGILNASRDPQDANTDDWIREYKSIQDDIANLRYFVQRDYSSITGKAASAVIASVRQAVTAGTIQNGENELEIRLIAGDMMCLEMLPLFEITNVNDAPGEEDSDFAPYVISEAEVECFGRASLNRPPNGIFSASTMNPYFTLECEQIIFKIATGHKDLRLYLIHKPGGDADPDGWIFTWDGHKFYLRCMCPACEPSLSPTHDQLKMPSGGLYMPPGHLIEVDCQGWWILFFQNLRYLAQ
ncbi:hypothetical protein BZA05DRAFT_423085 [Tricharina praecox]|uniref:uncharacterized protein n=1 Tax=Tricharina praecox TaxID=43433 RepID=UPI002220ADBF|nr:uncharacterized protein BZA05DRAFT_423085 [Tricharina praecox]KAI5840589.1 hypothetical protein BZA05DRAFT_423085 [Tricharina praecox]